MTKEVEGHVVEARDDDALAVAGVVETPVGRELWPNADARKLRQTAIFLATRNVALLMVCAACHKEGRGVLSQLEWRKDDMTNEVIAFCPCRLRILEGVTV